MSRKDYELIAKVFEDHRKSYGNRTDSIVIELIEDMANALQFENDKFDCGRFLLACGIEKTEVDKYFFDRFGNLQRSI